MTCNCKSLWLIPTEPELRCGPILTTEMDGNPPSVQLISSLFPQVSLAKRLCYIAWTLLLVAQSSSAERLGGTDRVCSLSWNMGAQLGRRQPRGGFAGRRSGAATSLCPIPNRCQKFLSCHVSTFQAGFLGVTWRVNSRSTNSIRVTFRALCAPSESKHCVVSAGSCGAKLLAGVAGALFDMQDRVLVCSVDATGAHSVVCERLAVPSGSGGARTLMNSSKSSGGSCGKDTHPTEHMSLTQLAIQASSAHFVTTQPDGFAGVELVSRATYISRKRRNWETRRQESKACKRAETDGTEISHEAAELTLRSQATCTDANFLASHTSVTSSLSCAVSVVPSSLVGH